MKKFKQDLEIGQKIEDYVIELFNKHNFICYKNKDKNDSHDFHVALDDIYIYFECKFDKMASKTGNIAIEFYNPKKNKASGITSSASDFWIYCLQEDSGLTAYIFSLTNLLTFIERHKPYRIINVGGDDNSSLLLYKKYQLIPDLFINLNNMDKNQLTKYLKEHHNVSVD